MEKKRALGTLARQSILNPGMVANQMWLLLSSEPRLVGEIPAAVQRPPTTYPEPPSGHHVHGESRWEKVDATTFRVGKAKHPLLFVRPPGGPDDTPPSLSPPTTPDSTPDSSPRRERAKGPLRAVPVDVTLALAMSGSASRAVALSRHAAEREYEERERFNQGGAEQYSQHHYYQGLTDQFNTNQVHGQLRSPLKEMEDLEEERVEAYSRSRLGTLAGHSGAGFAPPGV